MPMVYFLLFHSSQYMYFASTFTGIRWYYLDISKYLKCPDKDYQLMFMFIVSANRNKKLVFFVD